ncbi:MAG TPA: head GIN domain-containing protein, partial [Hymenobacter sp.]
LDLPAFDGLDVEVFAVVTVAEGSVQRVEVTGSADLLDQLQPEVRNGVLHLRYRHRTLHLHKKSSLQVAVTAPAFRQLKLTGMGEIKGLTPLTAPELHVALSGAGKATLAVNNTHTSVAINGVGSLTLSGTTTRQDVHINSAGNYYAFDLKSADTSASIAGIGNGEVNATNSLKANLSGVGNIRYRGKPANITYSINGLGKVEESN